MIDTVYSLGTGRGSVSNHPTFFKNIIFFISDTHA